MEYQPKPGVRYQPVSQYKPIVQDDVPSYDDNSASVVKQKYGKEKGLPFLNRRNIFLGIAVLGAVKVSVIVIKRVRMARERSNARPFDITNKQENVPAEDYWQGQTSGPYRGKAQSMPHGDNAKVGSEGQRISHGKEEAVGQPLETVIITRTVQYTPKMIFDAMYQDGAPLYMEWFERMKFIDARDSLWKRGDNNMLTRVTKYLTPLDAPIPGCPKYGDTTETKSLVACTESLLVVSMHVKTPNVPFGNTFYCTNKVVVMQKTASTSTYTVSQKITYTGFNLLKGIINKKSREETFKGYILLFELLEEKLPKAQIKDTPQQNSMQVQVRENQQSNNFVRQLPPIQWKLLLLCLFGIFLYTIIILFISRLYYMHKSPDYQFQFGNCKLQEAFTCLEGFANFTQFDQLGQYFTSRD